MERVAAFFMNYDKEIIRILTEAGDRGLQVQKIARHVFNSSNSFFCEVNFDDVYRYVQQFLKRNSKNPDSIIEKADAWGCYHLNFQSQETQQLMLQFREEPEEVKTPQEDLSLSLF